MVKITIKTKRKLNTNTNVLGENDHMGIHYRKQGVWKIFFILIETTNSLLYHQAVYVDPAHAIMEI